MKITYLTVLCSTALALILGYMGLPGSVRAQTSHSYRPFVATIGVKYFDSTGKVVRTELLTAAMRSDGSAVRVRESADGLRLGVRAFVDVGRGVRVAVDPRTKSVTTYKLKTRESSLAAFGARATETCSIGPGGEAATGETSTLMGYPVVRGLKTSSIEDERTQREVWMAPSLRCFPLKVTSTKYEGATVTSTSTEEVLAVNETEPDGSLFAVPEDFVERSPSEALALDAQQRNESCSACGHARSVLDKVYQARQ
jgi:hypothetical protein